MLNFENLDKSMFHGVGKYDIPQIEPVTDYPRGEFIPVHYMHKQNNPEDKIVHFFVHDYKFIRFWNQPDRYIQRIKKFNAVLSPDFSMFTDMPLAMQIYNQYRKHWLAAYWQMHGITVYPTISWSTPDSYEWCFDGEPVGGIVAVSSVGCYKDDEARHLVLQGYNEMMNRLQPLWVIWYGKVFEPCDWNVIRVVEHGQSLRNKKKLKMERNSPWEQVAMNFEKL